MRARDKNIGDILAKTVISDNELLFFVSVWLRA